MQIPAWFSLTLIVSINSGVAQAQIPVPPPEAIKASKQRGEVVINVTPCDEIPMTNPYHDACVKEEARKATFRKMSKFLPVGSQEQGEAFWDQSGVKALSSAVLLFENRSFASGLELVSGVLGPLRLSLGMAIASASAPTETEEGQPIPEDEQDLIEMEQEATNRLLQGGGTINAAARFPLFFTQSVTGSRVAMIQFMGGAAFDTPTADSTFNADPGISGSTSLNMAGLVSSDKIGVEAGLDGSIVMFNEEFQNRLAASKNIANIVTLRVGFIVYRKTRLGISVPLAASGAFDDVHTRTYLQQVVNF